jgi:hypothetical protein
MITMTPGISDPAEIAEVDSFERDLETLQHDDMQRWCSLASRHPFRRPSKREMRERCDAW